MPCAPDNAAEKPALLLSESYLQLRVQEPTPSDFLPERHKHVDERCIGYAADHTDQSIYGIGNALRLHLTEGFCTSACHNVISAQIEMSGENQKI